MALFIYFDKCSHIGSTFPIMKILGALTETHFTGIFSSEVFLFLFFIIIIKWGIGASRKANNTEFKSLLIQRSLLTHQLQALCRTNNSSQNLIFLKLIRIQLDKQF